MIKILPQRVLHLHLEERKKKPNILGDYIVSEKLDGIYAYVDYIDGTWHPIHSRAGRKIPAFEKQIENFKALPVPKGNYRFIMEAYIPGLDFHTMNGIFNRSVGDYHCKDVVFFLHDMIGIGHEFGKTALQRYNVLKYWDIVGNIKIHPILAVSDDKSIWLKYFNDVKETGGEGVVLKQAKGLYYPDKRNSSLMKIKLEDRFHLLCADMFYTVGDKGNSNLNITLRRKSGTEIVVRVGKHNDIDMIEKDKNHILGKACLIEAMCEITPGGMLREPRFKNVVENFNFEDLD